MPVEVREIVIKATVTKDGNSGPSANTATTDGQTTANEELIKICVDKVMEILKEKNGR